MSITKAVIDVDSAVKAAMNWTPADKSDFVVVDTKVTGENREAIYQRAIDADEVDFPSSIRQGYYPKTSGGESSANHSTKFNTWIRVTDSVTGEVKLKPLTVTLALSGPGMTGGLDATDLMTAVMNTVSWVLPLNEGMVSNKALLLLMRGIVNTLNTLIDTQMV